MLVVGGLAVRAALAERRAIREIEALRETVFGARMEAERCRSDLARAEVAFREFDELVDSLHESVRSYEALDERGVPRPLYEAYLGELDRYNDAVEAWESRADSLRLAEGACRTTVERHNALADSLRERLTTEGVLPPRESTGG